MCDLILVKLTQIFMKIFTIVSIQFFASLPALTLTFDSKT